MREQEQKLKMLGVPAPLMPVAMDVLRQHRAGVAVGFYPDTPSSGLLITGEIQRGMVVSCSFFYLTVQRAEQVNKVSLQLPHLREIPPVPGQQPREPKVNIKKGQR